jgi:hypothetical protein
MCFGIAGVVLELNYISAEWPVNNLPENQIKYRPFIMAFAGFINLRLSARVMLIVIRASLHFAKTSANLNLFVFDRRA